MNNVEKYLLELLDSPLQLGALILVMIAFLAIIVFANSYLFYFRLMFLNLRRNIIRTSLTAIASIVLVFVVTLVWTVLWFLNLVTSEKAKDFKAIITEKWQIPSQMPYAYEASLSEGAPGQEGDYKIDKTIDAMTWQFYGATIDPEKKTRDNIIFFFSMEPMKMTKMMDGMEEYSASQLDQLNKLCEEMVKDKRKIIVGTERLQAINKKVGERIKLTSFNYKGIDLEVEIIGSFPEGRYNQSAILNRDYLNDSLDDYNRKNPNSKHPMTNRNLNLVWIRVPDKDVFQKVERQITDSPSFTSPAVKVETASSGISTFLDAYRDLLWGLRWILAPFILATMALIIAVAISISVRERRKEIAVMKVIGFTPIQILFLVLGEAVMVGGFSGLISSVATTMVINNVVGGIKFPIAFFPIFMIPIDAIWWGPAIGISTALGGSLLPSLSACRVKVSEVFARTS